MVEWATHDSDCIDLYKNFVHHFGKTVLNFLSLCSLCLKLKKQMWISDLFADGAAFCLHKVWKP